MEEVVTYLLKKTEETTVAEALAVVQKTISGKGERITAEEAAILIHRAEDLGDTLFGAATHIRRMVYGTRMILFAPL